MTPDTIYVLDPDTRHRTVGGEGVVVRQGPGEVLVVNAVGSRVVELLDGTHTVDAVVDVLLGEYQTDRETLTRDINSYLVELLEAGVIEPATG